MKRILCILLAAVMLMPLTACGDTASPAPTADNGAQTDVVSQDGGAAAETEPAYVPETVDLDGKTFHVMSKMENTVDGRWTEQTFAVDEMNGDVVNDAIVERNQKLAELFNCDIENSFENMGGIFSYTLFQTISKLILAGDNTYDLYMPTIQDCAKLSINDYLMEWSQFDSFHLDGEWWNQVFLDATSIGGKVYYCDGDIAETFMRAAYAIFFNKDLIGEFGLENPYGLVASSKWSIPKVMEMAKAASIDLNSNGFMDSEDQIGLLVLYNSTEAFFAASGSKLVTVADDGRLTFTGDSERSVSVMNRIFDIYAATDVTVCCDKKEKMMSSELQALGNVQRGETLFSGGHALFLFGTMNNVKAMRSMDTDFGILPLPLADETQDRYYSYVHTWSASAPCIPVNTPDPESTAAFIEAAAYYAREIITPAYYDTMLKTKVSRDEESVEMLDMIYDNRWCDLGNIFNVGKVLSDFTSYVDKGNSDFVSMIASKQSTIEAELEEINALVG